jgi:hypothetical protein
MMGQIFCYFAPSCPRLDNGRAINFFSGSDTYLRLVKTFSEWVKSMHGSIYSLSMCMICHVLKLEAGYSCVVFTARLMCINYISDSNTFR